MINQTVASAHNVAVYKDYMPIKLHVYGAKLVDLGYFVKPASLNYHGAYRGGLFDHSLVMTQHLVYLTEQLDLKWSRAESPYIVGMFHDLCKCDDYIYDELEREFVRNDEPLLPGHGEKSVMMASRFTNLTDEEIMCIRWHMGAFDDSKNWNYYGKAVEKYPNVLYTHTADMYASRIKGV